MPSGRARCTALVMWVVVACGCDSAPAPTSIAELPCTVTPRDGPERVMLLSEARAARDAARRFDAEFTLAVPGRRPIELQLTSVGCNCYQVQRDKQTLTVGDRFVIPAGGSARVQIVSQPSVEPETHRYHAELSGKRSDGGPFTVSLAHEVRTLADIAVRPDVLQIDLTPESREAGHGATVQIEQHVRATAPHDIAATWDKLPDGLAATAPVRIGLPQEISTGVWRIRSQSVLTWNARDEASSESPCRLPIVSRLREGEIARTDCTLLVRRRTGISAPPLVHFGRFSTTTAAVRRVQLRALDDRPFAILSIAAREGAVEASVSPHDPAKEHWIEVRAHSDSGVLDDVLDIETDHPASRSLRILVKGRVASEDVD